MRAQPTTNPHRSAGNPAREPLPAALSNTVLNPCPRHRASAPRGNAGHGRAAFGTVAPTRETAVEKGGARCLRLLTPGALSPAPHALPAALSLMSAPTKGGGHPCRQWPAPAPRVRHWHAGGRGLRDDASLPRHRRPAFPAAAPVPPRPQRPGATCASARASARALCSHHRPARAPAPQRVPCPPLRTPAAPRPGARAPAIAPARAHIAIGDTKSQNRLGCRSNLLFCSWENLLLVPTPTANVLLYRRQHLLMS